ncbi:MAG: hypothetical protein GW947_00130 [Candidatus Pacebacteria bacterium]|nr:hypothetical protein [Candidatus Paceibacterota bacterium]
MPICILRVPKNYELAEARLREVCTQALEVTLKTLRIPDWDQEIRVERVGSDKETEVIISFTAGGVEYPDEHPDEIFDPNKELKQKVAEQISNLPELTQLQPHKVRLETWRNSFFTEVESITALPSPEGVSATNCKISIALSPAYIAETQIGGPPEQESPMVGKEFAVLKSGLENVLGNENGHTVELAISGPVIADTDISIDVDLKSEKALTAEQLETIANTVELQLRSSGLAKEGRVITIWVKQGEAEVTRV